MPSRVQGTGTSGMFSETFCAFFASQERPSSWARCDAVRMTLLPHPVAQSELNTDHSK